MLRNLAAAALSLAVGLGMGYADQPSGKVVVPVHKTPANDGRQMYVSYCGSCHGADGKGNGPVAGMLKKQPADLSILSRKNGGKFPSEHVAAVLQFGTANAAHGSAEMPVWGPVFLKMSPQDAQEQTKELRISNLNQYLQTIQQK
jgi:mono/diheme cytochrome c family protein